MASERPAKRARQDDFVFPIDLSLLVPFAAPPSPRFRIPPSIAAKWCVLMWAESANRDCVCTEVTNATGLRFKKLSIDPYSTDALSPQQVADLQANIDLCRDAIVFFTSCGAGTGYGGHTGGAYDTVPEVLLMDAFFRACPDKFVPTFFDEAGHRVATQYLFSVLEGHMAAERLVQYRQGHSELPGHPELGMTPGIKFSSGRLGHMWPAVNGVAAANPGKVCFCLGSDGSQMEGNDAEAARLAVSENLNVKLIVDDNDVTITGHPSQYFKGYSVEKTLAGHGLKTVPCDPESGIEALYAAVREAVLSEGPVAVIMKRKMCPGIEGVEGSNHGHDAVATAKAIPHLEKRGRTEAAEYLKGLKKTSDPYPEYKASGKVGSNRQTAGQTITECIGSIPADERKGKVLVIDSDLGGSTAMTKVQDAYPEVYIQSGIMERGNLSAAGGFGSEEGKQGITSTFAAFLEMCISEITMARLNKADILCHFSHSGVDDMADNTCHFGINNMFADNGLEDGYETMLYFPADFYQVAECVKTIFSMNGLRFVFTSRSKSPALLGEDGNPFFGPGYKFVPGKDDIVRKGTAGYIITFGDAAYRALDAVERLKAEGIDVGLIVKCTLNVVDEEAIAEAGKTGFVLVVEPLSKKTGLGSRFGTYLLERGLCPKYDRIGVYREGCGGLWEQAYHQGYDPKSIMDKVKTMI